MDRSSEKRTNVLLPLGCSTRPFRPVEAREAVRAVLGPKYNCSEGAWSDHIRTAKDRLTKQGFLEGQDRLWRSITAGRAEAEILKNIQAP